MNNFNLKILHRYDNFHYNFIPLMIIIIIFFATDEIMNRE